MLTLEEEIKNGGAGMLLAEELAESHGFDRAKIKILAVDDSFGYGEKNKNIYSTLGIAAEDVEQEIIKLI